jgi:hypothetical protein
VSPWMIVEVIVAVVSGVRLAKSCFAVSVYREWIARGGVRDLESRECVCVFPKEETGRWVVVALKPRLAKLNKPVVHSSRYNTLFSTSGCIYASVKGAGLHQRTALLDLFVP